MKNLEKLSQIEKEFLFKYPAYISLLAVNQGDGMTEDEKQTAIKFSHIKTFSCNPILSEFYKEADKVFERNIRALDNELPKEKVQRETAIQIELNKLEYILLKLEKEYASFMHMSMKSFKEHVSKSHHNVLEYFIFPLPIKGLTD
jgi:hypothetical protein